MLWLTETNTITFMLMAGKSVIKKLPTQQVLYNIITIF